MVSEEQASKLVMELIAALRPARELLNRVFKEHGAHLTFQLGTDAFGKSYVAHASLVYALSSPADQTADFIKKWNDEHPDDPIPA